MSFSMDVLAILLGVLVRLGLPLLLTVILVVILRKVDTRWQEEGELAIALADLQAEDFLNTVHCWDLRKCSVESRKRCQAAANPETACWELFKVDGYLQESCQRCAIRRQVIALSTIEVRN